MSRHLALASLLAFSLSAFATAGLTPVVATGIDLLVPHEATCGGKYNTLLRVIPAPGDESTYGKIRESGYSNTSSWAGQTNLPAGHWVYVAPNWYIWQNSTVAPFIPLTPAADEMTGKQVTVYLDNGTPVAGQLIENKPEYVVLLLAEQSKKKLIYKAKITSIEWPATAAVPLVPAGTLIWPQYRGGFNPLDYDSLLPSGSIDLSKW